jgi:hypothetical protein
MASTNLIASPVATKTIGTDLFSNRTRFIDACVGGFYTAEDAASAWDKAASGGIAKMVQLAQGMASDAASIGGTEEKHRACALASFIVLTEVREMLAAQ